jgi:hypothetical protein
LSTVLSVGECTCASRSTAEPLWPFRSEFAVAGDIDAVEGEGEDGAAS